MGTSSQASPFGGAPDPDAFFPGADRETVCRSLILDIVSGKRFLRLGGESGSGKTQICRAVMARLPGEIIPVYQDAPIGSFDEVMRHACVDLGAARSGESEDFSWAEEFDRLLAQREAEGNRVVLIRDQAERLFSAALERLLARVRREDAPAFGILLAGNSELDATLSQLAALGPNFKPDNSHTLAPLDRDETERYLRYRLQTAGVGWNEQDAILSKKRIDRIFREARGNIAATDEVAAEILGMESAVPPEKAEATERQLPLWGETGEGGEARRSVLSPRTPAAEAEPVIDAAAAIEEAAPEPESDAADAAESVFAEAAVAEAEAESVFESIVPQETRSETPEDIPDGEDGAEDEDEEGEEDEDSERAGLWEAIADRLTALEELVAPPVIALYEKLWGDKKILGSALGLALFFCILGLSLGTADQTEMPTSVPQPVETPAVQTPGDGPRTTVAPPQATQTGTPDGAALLRERLAAGRSLVAASYRGAQTILVLSLSGDKAERELAELLATPPFQREATNLYVVRKPGTPPAFFVFYGLFDDEEQARQARNNMGFELRAHHPYPLSVGEALRLNEH